MKIWEVLIHRVFKKIGGFPRSNMSSSVESNFRFPINKNIDLKLKE